MSGDRLKETLGFYKVLFSILSIVLIAVVSNMLNKIETETINALFYAGLGFIVFIVFWIVILVKQILNLLKEL